MSIVYLISTKLLLSEPLATFPPSSPRAFGGDPERFQRIGSPITAFGNNRELVIAAFFINVTRQNEFEEENL